MGIGVAGVIARLVKKDMALVAWQTYPHDLCPSMTPNLKCIGVSVQPD